MTGDGAFSFGDGSGDNIFRSLPSTFADSSGDGRTSRVIWDVRFNGSSKRSPTIFPWLLCTDPQDLRCQIIQTLIKL